MTSQTNSPFFQEGTPMTSQTNSPPFQGGVPERRGGFRRGGPGQSPQKLNNLPHLKTFRKQLRNQLTPAEARLWTHLKSSQLDGRKFRRQHSVGNYILDFYCPSERLAIELDGEVHNNVIAAQYDKERDIFLQHTGIKVLRFENRIVFENPEWLLSEVKKCFGWRENHPASNHPDSAEAEPPLLEKEGSCCCDDYLETADALLARIRQEREARYQHQLDDWKSAVSKWEAVTKKSSPPSKGGVPERRGGLGPVIKKPTKPRKPKPVEPLTEKELAELPELPEGWIAIRYGDICSVVRNGLSAKPVGSEGYKICRISAVRPMDFDYSDYRYLSCSEDEVKEHLLKQGDLVFTRYNGSRRYVGVCAMFNGKHERLFPDKLIQTRPDLPSIEPAFLEKVLNSGFSRAFIETKIRTTAGQSGVSGSDVKDTPIPLCSLSEQREIVRILEEQFSAIEQNECEIDAALERAEALRQSILKKAFSGKLVPQDPHDEPASVLLERIHAEREAKTKPKRKNCR